MFRSDLQRARVCQKLLGTFGVKFQDHWTDDGPTGIAIQIYEQKGWGIWSHGEQIIWKLAWCVWTSQDDPAVPFGEIIFALDRTRQRLVGTLVAAMVSAGAIDRWLGENTCGHDAPLNEEGECPVC